MTDKLKVTDSQTVEEVNAPYTRSFKVGHCDCGECGMIYIGLMSPAMECMAVLGIHHTDIKTVCDQLQGQAAIFERAGHKGSTNN